MSEWQQRLQEIRSYLPDPFFTEPPATSWESMRALMSALDAFGFPTDDLAIFALTDGTFEVMTTLSLDRGRWARVTLSLPPSGALEFRRTEIGPIPGRDDATDAT